MKKISFNQKRDKFIPFYDKVFLFSLFIFCMSCLNVFFDTKFNLFFPLRLKFLIKLSVWPLYSIFLSNLSRMSLVHILPSISWKSIKELILWYLVFSSTQWLYRLSTMISSTFVKWEVKLSSSLLYSTIFFLIVFMLLRLLLIFKNLCSILVLPERPGLSLWS